MLYFLEKGDTCAVKLPNVMETDGDSLKDILFEPAIHSVICANKKTKSFVPELKAFYFTPDEDRWISKCNQLVKNIDDKKENIDLSIPNGLIVSVMEKLDGSIDSTLKNKRGEQYEAIIEKSLDLDKPLSMYKSNELKNTLINDDDILTYILQMANALYHLYLDMLKATTLYIYIYIYIIRILNFHYIQTDNIIL